MSIMKLLFSHYQAKAQKQRKAIIMMCPYCRRQTIKDETRSCLWCQFPLL